MKKLLSILLSVAIIATTAIIIVPVSAETEGDYVYSVSGSDATITGYTGTGGAITIPNTLGGYNVKVIGNSAFRSINAITKIIIPEGIKTIESRAFQSCKGISAVVIPKSVKTIGDYNFSYCAKLQAAYFLGDLPEIGSNVFYNDAAGTGGNEIGFNVFYVKGNKGFGNDWGGFYSYSNVVIPDQSTFPAINTLTDKSKSLSGYSLPQKNITIVVGTNKFYTTANNYGKWTKILPRKYNIGTKIAVKVKVTYSNAVASKTTYVKPATPTVNKITVNSLCVSGKTYPKAKVGVRIGEGVWKYTIANSKGLFKLKLWKSLKYGNNSYHRYVYFKVTYKGQVSDTKSVTVVK